MKNLTRCTLCATTLGALIMSLMLFPGATDAHTNGFYDDWFFTTDLDNIPVYFDSDFPAGRARSRIVDAANQWNQLNRRMDFRVRRSPSIDSSADSPPPSDEFKAQCPTPEREGRNVGMVHWGTFPPPEPGQVFYGQVAWCWKNVSYGKHLKSFRLYLNRNLGGGINWHTGTGDSVVRSRRTGRIEKRADMWAIATHEFGHATGWLGHWRPYYDSDGDGRLDSRTPYCDYSYPPEKFRTMCTDQGIEGFERERTLSAADKHVFHSQYPAR